MNAPATSRIKFSTIRNAQGGSPRPLIQAETTCGICSVVSTNANTNAFAMMNISIAVTFALSISTRRDVGQPKVAINE